MPQIPRNEYPRPQFRRDDWLNLNGQWNFAFDFGCSGKEKGWHRAPDLQETITVPFCPESRLSGIEHTDFIPAVWYHRTVVIPVAWSQRRVLLHFGAVDYECQVWINGTPVGRHLGGSASFSFDITAALKDGENDLVVRVADDVRSGVQPGGKQSRRLDSHGVWYTRVTGIWQTVWMEAVPRTYLEQVQVIPDLDHSRFLVISRLCGDRRDLAIRAVMSGARGSSTSTAAESGAGLVLEVPDSRPWSPEDPFLYDLELQLVDAGNDEVVDRVFSYAGLRKFHIEGNRFYLNNRPLYLRLVLDQGYYPDGIWTAPSDADLRRDIELAQAVGFNGARLHQKVFEERFHYWADRLGYLTWGEFADWGMDFGRVEAVYNHQREWREVVVRDRNHPSIIAWTPFNETHYGAKHHREHHDRAVRDVYDLTRALDPSRPIHDCSGYVHVKTDIFTVHDYTQDAERFAQRYSQIDPGETGTAYVNFPDLSAPYQGQPYVVDEYGGTYWTADHEGEAPRGDGREQWGYGRTAAEVEELIANLTRPLLDNPHIAGFTYTQLTDVEQETNGIYTYRRQPKFNTQRLKEIFGAPVTAEEHAAE